MTFRNGGLKLARRAVNQVDITVVDLPAFLCPGILRIGPRPRSSRCFEQQSYLHTIELPRKELEILTARPLPSTSKPTAHSKLPTQCPGCGALSQTVDKDEPGFYTLSRRSMRDYFQGNTDSQRIRERKIIESSLNALEDSQEATAEKKGIIGELTSAFTRTTKVPKPSRPLESPVCDRCHQLRHHETGVPIHHPTIASLQDTIFESPHKYNHIYHVIDAADFPMSLVQGLHKLLHLTPQRSLNRRSQTGKFYHGKKTEVSFVITRSDLLVPTKEHVDKLMPYLRSVLRDALGRAAQDSRLGNVSCVSAKRQWWTRELKEDIWHRGGGGWMVGKVNVGKSQLFQEVFPKGRMGDWAKHTTLSTGMGLKSGSLLPKVALQNKVAEPFRVDRDSTQAENTPHSSTSTVNEASEPNLASLAREPAQTEIEPEILQNEAQPLEPETEYSLLSTEPLNTGSLLPPLPTETSYPAMPLVSALPGTTASPIRVPFGNGKGELIDLPGLSRSDLELHVQPEYRSSLVMRTRITPSQRVLKPGQSLLIGGFIRITPTAPDLHLLAYNFTPIQDHQTSTEKAIGIQNRTREASVLNISVPGTGEKIASAGKFHLKYDVTKERTGPVTRKDAAGIKVERLPYRVLGTDILIEGVGWVELAAQVRKPRWYQDDKEGPDFVEPEDKEERIDPSWPEIEVFTPDGKFIAQRRPMNAWLMVGQKPGSKDTKARPRKAMKGVKKTEKKRARERPQAPL